MCDQDGKGNKFVVMVVTILVVITIAGPAPDAQKLGRKQEVKTPGTDVSLKADWQLLFYEGCRFAVPVSWHANDDASLVVAPDGSKLSVRFFRITSWSAHKAQIRAAFGRVTVVHEDSDRRLWFEIGDKPRIQHFIDVANGVRMCSGLLEVRASTSPDVDDTTNRIVESIEPAPDK
jgi:hypothetical protein